MRKRIQDKDDGKLSQIYPWSRYAFGIDPGLKGGIACIDNIDRKVILAVSTPTKLDEASGKLTYDIPAMVSALSIKDIYDLMYNSSLMIERQQAMPKQGVVSMFTTGFGYGIWTAIITMLPIPEDRTYVVRSMDWQMLLKGETAKDETKAKSIARIGRLFPDVDLVGPGSRKRAASDGIADAINIADYLCLRMVYPDDHRTIC